MSLSDKSYWHKSAGKKVYLEEDVKQFIKELKDRRCIRCGENFRSSCKECSRWIDERAGEKLI
jgi:hypothetical protein